MPRFIPAVIFILVVLAAAVPVPQARVAHAAGSLIISEFRTRGPSGVNDEFVEIYNDSVAAHTVASTGGGGYAIVASDAIIRCVIPDGTIIPAFGHYLCANSVAYSLNGYATPDATFVIDMPDNAGIALFNNASGGAFFDLAHRFDAVGYTTEANPLYREGVGLPAFTGGGQPFSVDYTWARRHDPVTGLPVDTDNNYTAKPASGQSAPDTNDFIYGDTNGTLQGLNPNTVQLLGAPGPENLASPMYRNSGITIGSIDPACPGYGAATACGLIRDFTSVPAQNSTFGTITIQKRITNNTGANISRLRFRITRQTTFPAPSGFADLRSRTTADSTVTLTGGGNVTILGTTVEQPPNQPNGGGFNSSMNAGSITLGTPVATGASVNVRLLFGLQQTGDFSVEFIPECLPNPCGAVGFVATDTENTAPTVTTTPPATAVLATSATLSGNLTATGGGTISNRGILVSQTSVNANPLVGGTGVTQLNDAANGVGAFSENATGLTQSTNYTYRAFAISDAGVGYGANDTFATPAATTGTVTTTSPATGIAATAANLSGNVTSNGGLAITGRGVVYCANPCTPTKGTIGHTTLTDAANTLGAFTENAIGLSPNTTYDFRAFVTNSAGDAYGAPVSFTTLVGLGTVTTTSPATAITPNSASLSGNVTSNGGASITARGVVYCVNPCTPTNGTPGHTTLNDAANTLGAFTENATGLTPNTTYAFRAFVTNSAGTAYGDPAVFFTTLVTPAAPTVTTTSPAAAITQNTASLSGNVTSQGSQPITQRGIVLADNAVNPTPSVGGAGVVQLNDAANTVGAFNENAAGLQPGTNYAFRAFATNSVGTSYGATVIFTTQVAPALPQPTAKGAAPNPLGPNSTKSFSPANVLVGGTSTLSITVSNPNTTAMTGVSLTDTTPAGIQITSATATGSCGAGIITVTPTTLTLAGGTLAPGGSCTFSVQVKGITQGAWENTVTAVANATGAGIPGRSTLGVNVTLPPTKGLPVP